MKYSWLTLLFVFSACSLRAQFPAFRTIDTDFSKGRLSHEQNIRMEDLEKFHGHLCDGLVVGALAMEQALRELYPNQVIDRTNLRTVSKPSSCLTDVAIYLTGARYQFNTFYVDTDFSGLYIIQRIDYLKTVSVSLNEGAKNCFLEEAYKFFSNKSENPASSSFAVARYSCTIQTSLFLLLKI